MVREDKEEYDIEEGVQIYTVRDAAVEDNDPFSKDSSFIKNLQGVSSNKKRSITYMEKRFKGRDDAGTKQIEDMIITGYNALEVVLPPYNLDYLAKLYELNPEHYSAVQAKVSNIVGLGYEFIPSPATKMKLDNMDPAKQDKYNKKLLRAKNDLSDFIDSLNSEDEFAEILTKVWRDYETTGNGYIEISRSETTGEIGYIGHVPSTTIRVRRRRDGFVQIISNQAVFFRNFGDDDTDPIGGDSNPSELIHIKKYAPSSTFYGVPDIVAAKAAVAGQDFSSKFNLDYFENKAVPRHVVILKGATIAPNLAKNILEFFETGLKGKNHRSLFIPLPGDTPEKKVELKIEPVEAGIQDASFINYRKMNRDEILMAHRVPITKVSIPTGVSLAVAADAGKTFKEQVCQPEQSVLEKKLNKIIKQITDGLFLIHLNEQTLTDENTQSQIDERRIKTGVELPNEQRARRGQGAIPGGDSRVDLNAKGGNSLGNDNRAKGNRERDAQRSSARTDTNNDGRSPKGEGRTNGVT